MNLLRTNLFIILSMILCTPLSAHTGRDAIIDIVQQEINRNLEILSRQEIPAYYISCRVFERNEYTISSQMGAIIQDQHRNDRELSVIVRVGNHQTDNFSSRMGYATNGKIVLIPLDNDKEMIRLALWNTINQLYYQARQDYNRAKLNQRLLETSQDTTGTLSYEPSDTYIEKRLPFEYLQFEPKKIKEELNTLTKIFRKNPNIIKATAIAKACLNRTYFIDTEKRVIVQNEPSVRVVAQATIESEDGNYLPAYRSFYAPTVAKLPSFADIRKNAEETESLLTELRQAPVADSYNGPILLSEQAAGVFFHEFFGHRVEASRMKSKNDAQTYKNKIGTQIMNPSLSVTFDPTLKTYGKIYLGGHYKYDDEGIKGQKVEVVKDGILCDLLTNRTPINGFTRSNGHGRGEIYKGTESRQSNLIVTAKESFTNEELREKLIGLLKAQNKPYGYYIKEISGGYTQTGVYMANTFVVNPTITYRIYADGRPDEMVRGVNIIGTPLTVFTQIEACGNTRDIFNGICGAQSGNVPVSCIAPSLLIKNSETQRTPMQNRKPTILPRP